MSIIFNILRKYFKEVIIVGLVIVVLLMRSCGGGTDDTDRTIVEVDGKEFELVKQTIDTVFVEKIVEVPTYVPKYITKIKNVIVEIPADVDSLQIIKDYYTKYIVKDTLQLTYDFGSEITIDSIGNKPSSSLGFGVLTDTITQNKVISRDVVWNFQIPTIYNTTIVKELPKRVLYYGAGMAFDQTNAINQIKVGLLYKDKKDKMWGFDVGAINIDGNVTPYIGGSMYWKLSFKKKK